jgi:hypothetical protein
MTPDQMRRARRQGETLPHHQAHEMVAQVEAGHIRTKWHHGLGDVSAFTQVASSYLSRGWKITADVNPYSANLWRAVGCEVVSDSQFVPHPYHHGPNKIKHNIGRKPWPEVPVPEVWTEIKEREPPSLSPWLSPEGRRRVEEIVGGQAPVVLHTVSHTWHSAKDLPPELTAEVVKLLRADGHRVVVLGEDFSTEDVVTTWHLLDRAAGVIAVGAGIQLLASHWTTTRTLGVWHQHRPETYSVPRSNTRHLARKGPRDAEWPVVEYAGEMPDARVIVALASGWFKRG